jgi:hypothetical protein
MEDVDLFGFAIEIPTFNTYGKSKWVLIRLSCSSIIDSTPSIAYM